MDPSLKAWPRVTEWVPGAPYFLWVSPDLASGLTFCQSSDQTCSLGMELNTSNDFIRHSLTPSQRPVPLSHCCVISGATSQPAWLKTGVSRDFIFKPGES